MTEAPAQPPATLERPDGATLAYHATAAADPGDGRPGVVFCGGFMSDMTGTKATALEAYAQDRGLAFVRFDYLGHGASSGAFTDGTIGRWAEDAVAVLDQATEGPQILIGSSMGGWTMLRRTSPRTSSGRATTRKCARPWSATVTTMSLRAIAMSPTPSPIG